MIETYRYNTVVKMGQKDVMTSAVVADDGTGLFMMRDRRPGEIAEGYTCEPVDLNEYPVILEFTGVDAAQRVAESILRLSVMMREKEESINGTER